MTTEPTKGPSPGNHSQETSPPAPGTGPSPLAEHLHPADNSGQPHGLQPGLRRSSNVQRRQLPTPPGTILKRILLFLLVAATLYSLAGFFLTPYLLTSTLPAFLSKKLNRPVAIGSARFNPYTLKVTLKNGIIGPDLTDADDAIDPIFSFGKLEGHLKPTALFSRSYPVTSIRGASLFVHLQRHADGSFNVMRMIQRLMPPSGRFRPALLIDFLQSGGIHLTDSRLYFNDQASGNQHKIEAIRFVIPEQRDDSATVSPHFSAMIDGSAVSIGGHSEQTATGQSTSLTLTLEQIHLPDYLVYLPRPLPGLLSKGQADVQIVVDYQVSAEQTGHFEIRGSGVGRDLWLSSPDKAENTIASASFSFRFAPLQATLTFDKLSLEQPSLQIQRHKDGAFSFPATLRAESNSSESAIKIKNLMIKNGRLSFIDQKVEGGFGAIFNDINLSMEPLADKDHLHTYALDSVTSRATRIASQGTVNLVKGDIEGLLVLHNLPVTALNSYLPTDHDIAMQSGIIDKAEARLQIGLRPQDTTLNLQRIQGSVTNLDISQQGKEWLHIDHGLFAEAAFAAAGASPCRLGKLTLRGLSTHLSPDSAPLFQAIVNQPVGEHDSLLTDLVIDSGVLMLRGFSFQKKTEIPITITNLRASALRPSENDSGTITANLSLPGRASCQLTGNLSIAPLAGTLQIDMQRLPLGIFSLPETQWLETEVQQGTIDIKGALSLADYSLSGRVLLADTLLFNKNTQEKVLQIKEASASQFSLTLQPFDFKAESLALDRLELFIDLTPDTTSATALFFKNNALAERARSNVTIRETTLTEATLHFRDQRLKPPFATALTGVHGTIGDLINEPGQPCHINISGHGRQQATLTTKGTLHLFDDNFGADLNIDLRRQPLTPLIPYLEPMVGYRLAHGNFDLSMSYKEQAGSLKADSRLTVRKLGLGDEDLGNKHFPTTIALVTDDKGEIRLPISLANDMTDPSYTLYGAYGKKMRGLISKASVSPFSMLTDFYDPKQPPDHVLFEAGTAEPTTEAQARLRAISDILKARPLLRVTIKGYSAGSLDREALLQRKRREAEKKRLAQQKTLSSDLIEAYGREEIEIPANLPPAEGAATLTVAKEELLELARQRCRRLKEILTQQYRMDERRIVISSETTVVPESGAGLAGNRADFILGRLSPVGGKGDK